MKPQPDPARTGVIATAAIGACFLGWLWGVLITGLLILGGYVGPPVSMAELVQWQIPSVIWVWGAIAGLGAGLVTALSLSFFFKE